MEQPNWSRMVRWVAATALVAGLVPAPIAARAQGQGRAQGEAPAAPSVAGRWSLGLETPHGTLAMSLEVAVDAKDPKVVTGTLRGDQLGDFPFKGQFIEGRLTFTIESDQGEMRFLGTLKDADHLAVIVSAHGGDLSGEAVRAKG